MGSMIKGTCKNCGYEIKNLYFGGGFSNFSTYFDYPVLDKVEKVVKIKNIMDKDKIIKQNPNIVFYDNEALMEKDSQTGENYIEWDDFKLYDQGYLCPKCNHYCLGFFPLGF